MCDVLYNSLEKHCRKKCKGVCLIPKGNMDSFQVTVLALSISGKSKKHHGKDKPLRGFD